MSWDMGGALYQRKRFGETELAAVFQTEKDKIEK